VSTGAETGKFILLGKVAKPHGIHGEVKIYPYSGQPENFTAYSRIFIAGGSSNELAPYAIEKSRVQGKLALLKLADCSSRQAAEDLVGKEIWLQREDLPELVDSEYYWLDLEGKMAVTEDGRKLGEVTAIFATGAHDVMSVSGSDGEYLIPVLERFIVRIDEFEVVLNVPPGLLDINR
jgi:16S rRNA processing protein RimM